MIACGLCCCSPSPRRSDGDVPLAHQPDAPGRLLLPRGCCLAIFAPGPPLPLLRALWWRGFQAARSSWTATKRRLLATGLTRGVDAAKPVMLA